MSSPMKAILCSVVFALLGSAALAQSPFKIDLVGTGKQYIYLDDQWNRNGDCIEAKVSTESDSSGLISKVYFYDGDGKLIHTESEPSDLGNNDGGTIKPPSEFKAGKKYELYFGIPKNIESGPKKWKRAIVVFGQGSSFAARVYPKDDIAKFDFPEKSNVK